jgi:hypothetical protein
MELATWGNTTERNVQKLYERYSILLHASAKIHAKKVFQEVTEEHGGIILSIDGVQPEKGNETLYVIREVLSGTVVAAQNLKSSAAIKLKTLFISCDFYSEHLLGKCILC